MGTRSPISRLAGAALLAAAFSAGASVALEQNLMILYGATIDKVTSDASAQFLTHDRALQP